MVQPAAFPLLLLPLLIALGLAVSPRFMLRLAGWFIALNLLLVGCILVLQPPPPGPHDPVRRPAPAAALRAPQ